jgi:hypothetical protein
VDDELEVMWTSAALVQDLVLGKANGPSSLVTSLSMVVDEVESQINTAATIEV